MTCKKCVLTIFLLFHFCLLSTWAASAGLFDLHMSDDSYVQTERLAADLKLSLITAKLSDMAYQDNLSAADSAFLQDNSIQFEQFFSHQTLSVNANGFFAHKMITINGVSKKLIVIAFRGTDVLRDWATDAKITPTDFIENSDIKVHLGFHNYMTAFRNNEPSLDHDAIYLLTGHSLGGAIAKLYGASLRERGISKENVLVYTFGAPPVAYKSGGFFDRYNKQSGSLPLHIFESAHKLDPVYHIAYKKVLLSYFKRTEDMTYLPFQEDGKIGTLSMGCDTRGAYPWVGDFLFGDDDERSGCEAYAHSMGLYTFNIYQNLDMTSIIEANIIDTDPDEDVQINFDQYQLQQIENLAKNSPYFKGVAGQTFESAKLTRQENIALVHKLKKIGIFTDYSMFGSLGDDYRLMIKDIVDSKKTVLEIAKNQIDSAQSLNLDDYAELGFGTVINSVSVTADILTLGGAGATKFAAKFPGISLKVVSLGDKFADLSRLGKITVKTMPHIKKAVEISKTPQFKIIKALIEANFAINDNVKGIIEQNEAGVGIVKASLGLTGELVKAQLDESSQGKAYAFMLEKIVDIAGNLIAGTNEVLFADKDLETAFHELGDAIIGLVPFYGPFHSQWALGKKVSDDIDNRPELKDAWDNFHSTYQAIQTEIEILGNATRLKRLDVIMSKALTEIKQHYVQLAFEEALAENRKPKLIITLPEGATIENYHIHAQAGETIGLSPFLTAKDMIECIDDMAEYEVLWKLWYYDGTKGSHAPREALELTLDLDSQTYSFTMPSSQIFPVSITYNILNEPDLHTTYGNCGMPEKWTTVFADNGGGPGVEPGECPAGATDIACEVGLHIVGSCDPPGQNASVRSVTVAGNYLYVVISDSNLSTLKMQFFDISDPTNPSFAGGYQTSTARDVTVVGNYAYVADNDYGLRITDISDPENPVFAGSYNTPGYAGGVSIKGNYAYVADYNSLQIIDISDPASPVFTGSYSISANVVTVAGNYAYVTGDNYLRIIDISDPANPVPTGSYNTPGSASSVIIEGNYAYVADGSAGLQIIDISNPANPEFAGSHNTPGSASSVTKEGNYAYVADGGSLQIIDVSNPVNPVLADSFETPDWTVSAVDVEGNYAYVGGGGTYNDALQVIDISNPVNSVLAGAYDTYGKHVVTTGNYAYVGDDASLQIFDISDPASPVLTGTYSPLEKTLGISIVGNYAYVTAYSAGLQIIDISNPANPVFAGSYNTPGKAYAVTIVGNYAYVADYSSGLQIIDISEPANPVFAGTYDTRGRSTGVTIAGNYAFVADTTSGLQIINISNPANPVLVGTYSTSGVARFVTVEGNYAFVADGSSGLQIINISDPAHPVLAGSYNTSGDAHSVSIMGNYAYVADDLSGLQILSISDVANPVLVGTHNTSGRAYWVTVAGSYAFVADGREGLKVIDWQKVIDSYQIIQAYYYPTTHISLTAESPQDYEVYSDGFVKYWNFNENISGFDITVVGDTYSGAISSSDLIINHNILSVTLSPDLVAPLNTLELQFTNSGNPVQVSGSDTFWSQTRTNHAPRLADGQTTQLISATTETAGLTINTFDADNDTITLTIEDGAGGYVGFDPEQPNRLFASFSDGQSLHTIKIGLDDGKEKVVKDLTVMQFDQWSVIDFYSDVDPASPDYFYDGIAFGTLKGVVAGQPDPNDSTKRIFRPTDNASLAEALAMVINAEKLAGLISLETSNAYLKVFPAWAMPYYTFARDTNALDEEVLNLANIYPTREEVAKLIVKTLALDEKAKILPALNVAFTDEDQFSDADMLYYGKIAHGFGLFMTGDDAQPLKYITRAELALVIKNIFMFPSATLTLTPASVEYGDSFDITLTDADAEAINSSINLYDSSEQLTFIAIVNQEAVANPVASADIFEQAEIIYAFIDNHGVRNVIAAPLQIVFSDQDNDGVQDRHDYWAADIRYSTDANGNNIPDLLDSLYYLSGYDQNSVVHIDGQLIAVSEIIANGGVFPVDLDGDGIADDEDEKQAATIRVLQTLVGQPTGIISLGDVDGDGLIGMAEAVHSMQQSAQSTATQ